MANYKAYPEYKTTGLGWLTEIPDHWEVKKLKYLGQAIIGLTYSPDDVVDEGEGTLVLRSSNVQNGKLEFSDNIYVRKSIPLHLKVKEGDILICARNGSRALIGKNAKITKDAEGMTFGTFMSIFRSRYNSYLSHVFASALFEYQSGSFLTATINQLTTSNLNSFEIPLPPQTEQDRIVNFLDHETAKIDNLIEKQQQLIELLKEKRQAVISHAVTKGLNPDVPMKDSGVEWLGEVPAHWIVSGFKKYLSSIVDYRGKTPNKTDDGILLVTARNIKKGGLDYTLSQEFIAPSDYKEVMSRGLPDIGDVLFTTEAPLGEVANVDRVDIALAQRIIKFKGMTSCLNNYYFKYFIMSSAFQQSLNLYSSGSTAQGIKAERFVYLKKLLPPINEQIEIVDFLDKEISKIDILVEQQFVMLSLLQERRAALISAAVTGKIDVRDWVAPDTQESEEPQEVSA
ncbi:restriction endonuclease subunit S [Edwardsiella tarda]|uniref:restriction endonuclease subunit S n=1 Tax=Edwardsiella tarda TaxID=636 RepID=UPI00351C8CD1